MLVSLSLFLYFCFFIEMATLEVTDGGAATAVRQGPPKLCRLSRHHLPDMPAAYGSSNVIIKDIIYVECKTTWVVFVSKTIKCIII